MKYVSTRSKGASLTFEQAVMTGLAKDGGLLVPESIPDVSKQLKEWQSYSFVELSEAIFRLYAEAELSK